MKGCRICSVSRMRRLNVVANEIFLALLTFSMTGSHAQSQAEHVRPVVVPLHKMPPVLWVEKVWGDPSKAGEPFAIRIHNDAGYIVVPHVHPMDENIVVVKGVWWFGMGSRCKASALEPLEPGTFGFGPKNMLHFAWSRALEGEATLLCNERNDSYQQRRLAAPTAVTAHSTRQTAGHSLLRQTVLGVSALAIRLCD